VTARLREPEALVHPTVARAVGISSGQRVDIVSACGRITMRAHVTSDVHPECVVLPAGWAQANPNLLIGERKDPISGFPAFRSGVCRVEVHQG
jgi:anaerobic selenocysteine-containing dehydrogenase